MSNNKRNAKKVRKLAEEDPSAYAVLGWLSSYSNWIDEIEVKHAEKKVPLWARKNMAEVPSVTRKDIIRVMKTLEALKVGQFWIGRRGAESRFEFWVHRGQLGKAALGQVKTLKIDEDVTAFDSEELIETHRQLIANALELPVSAVRIKVREVE